MQVVQIPWGTKVSGKTIKVKKGDVLFFRWRQRRPLSLVQFSGPNGFAKCLYKYGKIQLGTTLVRATKVGAYRTKPIPVTGTFFYVSSYNAPPLGNDCTRKIRPVKMIVEAS